MDELVAHDEADGIEGAALAQDLLEGEVATGRHVALGHAAGPSVTAAVAEETVVAEPGDLVLAELAHQRGVLELEGGER